MIVRTSDANLVWLKTAFGGEDLRFAKTFADVVDSGIGVAAGAAWSGAGEGGIGIRASDTLIGGTTRQDTHWVSILLAHATKSS